MEREIYAVGQVVTYMQDGHEHIGEIEFIYSSGRVRIIDAHDTSVSNITGIVSDVPKRSSGVIEHPRPQFKKKSHEEAHQKHIESVVDSVTNHEFDDLFDSLTKFNNDNWRTYWIDVALLNNDEEMFKKFA